MLEHLRQRVIRALSSVQIVTLSTTGPAGLQASRVPCAAQEMELYLLVPRASEHLFNIETQTEVAIVNEAWSLRGQAHLVPRAACPAALAQHPEAEWSEVVHIGPLRMTLLSPETGMPTETIDLE